MGESLDNIKKGARKGVMVAAGALSILASDPSELEARFREVKGRIKLQDSQYAPYVPDFSSIMVGQEAAKEGRVDIAKKGLEASQKSIDLFERIWGAYTVEVGRLAKIEKEVPARWRTLARPEDPSTDPADADMAMGWRHGFGLLRRMDWAHERISTELKRAQDGNRIPNLDVTTRATIEHIAGLWAEFQKIPDAEIKERALAFKHFFDTRMKKPVPREAATADEKEG